MFAVIWARDATTMEEHHHRSKLKQQNKKFKETNKSSKRSVSRLNKGKVEAPVHNVKSSSSLGSENVKSSSSLGSAGKAVLLGANRPKPPPPPRKTKRLKLAFGRISHKYSCRD